MDVKIKTDNIIFNYCARAIIEQDGKILLICVDDAPYYHLPGGHVEIGETSENAVLREVQEEVGIDVIIEKLALMNEQFYNKKGVNHHSMLLYYLAKPSGQVSTENSIRMEQVGTRMIKNELRWVTREELKKLDVRPQLVKDLIIKNNFDSLRHVIR